MKKERIHKTKYGTVSLPLPLIEKIKKKMEGTGISSVSAYVAFVLRQIFSETNVKKKNASSRSEEEEVKNRLKRLGYI